MEHFKEVKVKILFLRFDQSNERMFVLKTGLYTEKTLLVAAFTLAVPVSLFRQLTSLRVF